MYEYISSTTLILVGAYQANFFKLIVEIIIRCIFYNVTITNRQLLRGIDRFIHDSSDGNLLEHGNNKTPMKTWHLRWRQGPIILIKDDQYDYDQNRSSYSYTIYGFRKDVDKILEKIENQDDDKSDDSEEIVNSKNKVEVAYFDSPSPYTKNFTRRKIYLPSTKAFPGQDQISTIISLEYMDRIQKPFAEQPKKRIGALLMGQHGVGKSDTAKFISYHLQSFGIKPVIVYGYDLTAPGVTMEDVWGMHSSSDNPVILVLNEFDKACEYAEKNEVNSKGYRALAQNKTTLDDLLDRLESEPYMIVILTSNNNYEYFEQKYPSYVRRGRLDYAFTMTKKKCIEHNLLTGV